MSSSNTHHQAAGALTGSEAFKAILRVTSGNFMEQFDFFLFGFYASYISHTFFPSDNDLTSLLKTFAVFATGFLMRPIGAVILGAYIDRIGRRQGLILTLTLMAFGTLIIAVMPGYEHIGLFAPLLVLLARLVQGFSAGVELGGVSVYLSEIAKPGHKGFYVSWQSGSQQIAILIASILGFAVNEFFSSEEINAWAWRIPFLVGCAIIPLIFILRRNMQETAAFEQKKTKPSFKQALGIMRENWKIVLCGMLLVAMTTTNFYFITVYTPTYGVAVLNLSKTSTLAVTAMVAISNFIWLPIGGAISDKFGRKPLMLAMSALAFCTVLPAMHWLASAPSFGRMALVLLYMSFTYGIYNGTTIAALTEIMPESVRTAGFSLAYSLATAVFGGLTPIIATYLFQSTGSRSSPALWLMFAAVCAFVSTCLIYSKNNKVGRVIQ
ncbi:MFS transporter [Brackiella oedipodis]|uniref:MFS transporter n=1 Tax=Brackiella oedipodis TaxID=124225 RepID=UPI00048CADD8|nr:MFS transporter [Brackiella oedipodis]